MHTFVMATLVALDSFLSGLPNNPFPSGFVLRGALIFFLPESSNAASGEDWSYMKDRF